MTETLATERRPSTAALLSLLYIGLGHIYCGRLVTGLALSLIAGLPAFFAILMATMANPTAMVVGLGVTCLIGPAVYLYAIIDSYCLARQIGSQYVLKDYNRVAVYILLIASGVATGTALCPLVVMNTRANIAEAFSCAGDSMSPTLVKGDLFLVNKLQQRKPPRRGDIVVFLCPEDREARYVKRVVGLPGDLVQVMGDGEVAINGERLKYESAALPDSTSPEGNVGELAREINGDATYRIQRAAAVDAANAEACPETKVPPGHCYVLGDNRTHAVDSRRFGCVPMGDILGKAELIYYPAKQWSRFGKIEH